MILLVDDNRVSREALAQLLRLNGHGVTEAADAREGMDILDNIHCDLIITDFVMPNITGVQFIHQVRQKWPHTPILLMSGYLSPEVGVLVSRGVGFLPKPIEMPSLLQTIERLLLQQK
jgi:CheY-like chemotaxis protein